MNGIGHNSGEVASERLKTVISRIEKLEENRDSINEDLRDVYAEAKGSGFDAFTLRQIISTRKKIRKNAEKHREQLALFDLYAGAIGMET